MASNAPEQPTLFDFNFRFWDPFPNGASAPLFSSLGYRTPIHQGRNTSHSYKAFECALKAAGQLEDADWALQLREAANKGGKESVDLDQAAVDVLVKAGRLEEARAVLKVRRCFQV